MSSPSTLQQITKEMRNYKLEILGLCETRWNGSGEFRSSDGLTLLYSGKPVGENRESGVSILLSKSAVKSLLTWQPISDRIITARFKSHIRNISLVQCYAPTDVASIEDKIAFYDKLYATILNIQKGDILLLMGDFNAQIGPDNTNNEQVIGKHALGNMTENGEFLIDCCHANNLIIGGSLFPHKRIHKVTWVSPDHLTENQIDHILISRKWKRSLLDVRAHRGADVGSDHHLVIGFIRLKVAATRQRNSLKRNRFNTDLLTEDTLVENFNKLLGEKANNFHTNGNLDEDWNFLKQSLLDTASQVLGNKVVSRKPWLSDETWTKITDRKEAKQQLNMAKTTEEKARLQSIYNEKHKLVKRSARHDKRVWKENLATSAQRAAEQKNTRELYRITKQLGNNTFSVEHPVKDKNGQLLTATNDQLSRWHEFFSDLLSINNNPLENLYESSPTRPICVNTNPPSDEETIKAIQSLKNHKAAGMDNIPAELLRAGVHHVSKLLSPILSHIWNNETLPAGWQRGLIVKLPKKGDLTNCDNWRGITLLNTCYKVLAKVIYHRISPTLLGGLRKEQAGFRPRCSCIDHINSLRIIVEQSVEWRSPLYMVFVDFRKAFDTLRHESIWQSLRQRRIPGKLINIIQLLYQQATCHILHKGNISDPINVQTGVRQGCVLSPLLFNIVLDDIMRKVTENSNGISWTLNNKLDALEYADDICLLAHTHGDMASKIQILSQEAMKAGLQINVGKTKSMRVATQNTEPFHIGDQTIEEVNSFMYLGSIITTHGGTTPDIKSRISKAQLAFGLLRNVWNSAQYAKATKLRIFNSNVVPVLLYGCETWKTSKAIIQKLQVFVNRCLRRILRIFWPNVISNKDLWEVTKQKPVDCLVKQRKWKWIGHTLRREPSVVSRVSLDWNPQGSRKRGRPADTWRRLTLKEATDAGKTWREIKFLAQDRGKWRKFIEALCFTHEQQD